MGTHYFINGKRVSAGEYFKEADADEERKFMIKKCLEYYERNSQNIPKEYSQSVSLLMLHWEKTDDYENAKKEYAKKKKRTKLYCLLIMGLLVLLWISSLVEAFS